MAKVRILSPAERKAFQSPPIFQDEERGVYFEITQNLKKIMDSFHSSYRKVGFLLQWGYFRRAGCFFKSTQFYKLDIIFVCQLLAIDHRSIKLEAYKEHRLLLDQKKIMELLGFKSFSPEARILLLQEINHLVAKQIRPKMMIYYLSEFFFQKKIVLPSYQQLSEMIIQTMDDFENKQIGLLKNHLSKPQTKALDQLLSEMNEPLDRQKDYYARAPIISWRKFPLSTKPGKIKESVNQFLVVKQLFEEMLSVIQHLSLSSNSIRYYATWVQKAKVTQLLQIQNPYKRHLHLIAFITHHYYSRQDLLVDILLQSIQSTLNRIEKKQKELDQNNKKEKDHATYVVSQSYRDKTELLQKINTIVNTTNLSAEEKVIEIKGLLSPKEINDPIVNACLETLDKEIKKNLNNAGFYDELEKQSLKLQHRLGNIVKHLKFNAINSKLPLLQAIDYFKEKDGKTFKNPPLEFLTQAERSHVINEQGKIRPSLYKALLFKKIAEDIRSGEINLIHSYRYLAIDEYLINKSSWLLHKIDYLNRAKLNQYGSFKKTLLPLQKKLKTRYQEVNDSINHGNNPHLSFNKAGEFIIDTPKVEKMDTARVAELLKQKNYVSILEILHTIDRITHFSECLQHYSVVQKLKKPDPIVFYAGIMGKGCNIGLGKLASVSKGINGNTLETVVNWYFSNDHLMAANQKIIHFMNKLTLPNMMRKYQGKLHTSSDGQKRNVDFDSILANFSFKYHGSGRGVSIYDFIDERHILFHSLVMSSSEREAAYVIDGLMCNDEIKSDIHSTDTHGYSDVIFAITHLLGISFAPRLAKLKKRSLYSIDPKKTYKQKGYLILPDQTINTDLIADNWDNILRLVATIKLKESTASQILKRLSSYAKDNPLYQGLKEFGKLIKTIFILTYLNNLELRQAIQKQLNKIELANKFSDAVFFDNNQEFKQGPREDQEIAMSCKIVLQNAIILWNYLYLSQLLATTEDPNKHNELLKIIQNGSIMTWQHINLLGEYDFRNKPAENESFFDMEKILAWSA